MVIAKFQRRLEWNQYTRLDMNRHNAPSNRILARNDHAQVHVLRHDSSLDSCSMLADCMRLFHSVWSVRATLCSGCSVCQSDTFSFVFVGPRELASAKHLT